MSKEKVKYVDLYFRKSPKGTGYHAGLVHPVPEGKAKEFIRDGSAAVPTQVLPKDLPYRKELIAAGIETLDEVTGAKDIKEVKGIGEAAEKEIAEYLKNSK